MTNPLKSRSTRAESPSLSSEFYAGHGHPHRLVPGRLRSAGKKPLRVMKFGGTSVGDASCMERVVEIIRTALRESDVVVVVSAMSGVTNQLVAAASHAEAGDYEAVAAIFRELLKKHNAAANALIHSLPKRSCLEDKMEELFQAGDRLCQGTMLLGEVTARTRDSILSLGERLSVSLVAAALAERGMPSAAIEATEMVVTDGCHGAADPCMDQTRELCEARLRPLLRQGVVPVVTGFIGATADGVLTTLGRGGSDYSATILGAALDADEVTIWTDVDGMQTADPRLVPEASTISEISYREASELAYFGAKVLHPKTLRPVMQCGIPLWIRNTFAPERPGTKITPAGPPRVAGVQALSALGDVVMITVGGPGLARAQDVLGRTLRTTAAVRADVFLISQASSQNDLCLVIPSALGTSTVEALRREFAHELEHEPTAHIALDATVATVTIVGQNMKSIPGIADRSFQALGRRNVNIIAVAHGTSECAISFVVARKDMPTALVSIHQEFQLGSDSHTNLRDRIAVNLLLTPVDSCNPDSRS
jgi:aspartokinase/homoserine dehydrogenase 1